MAVLLQQHHLPHPWVLILLSHLFFVPRTTVGSQPGIKSSMKKKEKAEADKLVSGCLLWSDVPFNIAKTNPFYQPMFYVVAVVGPGYKAPHLCRIERASSSR